MAANQIQFQHGMSPVELNDPEGRVAQCAAALERRRRAGGFICLRSGQGGWDFQVNVDGRELF